MDSAGDERSRTASMVDPAQSGATTQPDPHVEHGYARSSDRDRFLDALDGQDAELTARLAVQLTGCSNPLPSVTCVALGLPVGSSYGSAARQVVRDSQATQEQGSKPAS
jgi:hypothetical protein